MPDHHTLTCMTWELPLVTSHESITCNGTLYCNSSDGKDEDVVPLKPNVGFCYDTWTTRCMDDVSGRSRWLATEPTFSNTLYGPMYFKLSLWLDIGNTNYWTYNYNLRYTREPTVNSLSEWRLSAWRFIWTTAMFRCSLIKWVILLLSVNHVDRLPVAATNGSIPSTLGYLPYKASKGDLPSVECNDILYQNSAKVSQSFHFLGHAWTKHLRNVSTHWLTLSDCPSVWRW
jgi:hypothetical protein